MSENKKIDESLNFVSRYYEDGSLMPRQGWYRFRLTHSMPKWRRNVAAACIGAVVMVASASVYYVMTSSTSEREEPGMVTTVVETTEQTPYKVAKIQFTDAALKDVVKEIEKTYGVKVANVPEEETRLTISYEGNAYDVVETINDLLGINLKIEEDTDQERTK